MKNVVDLDDWPEMKEHPRVYEHMCKVTEELGNAKRDAKCWRTISIVLGIVLSFAISGLFWLLDKLL